MGWPSSIDVDTRVSIVLEARKLVERATRWLVVNRRPPFDIADAVESLRGGVAAVRSGFPKLLSGRDLVGFDRASRVVRCPRGASAAR